MGKYYFYTVLLILVVFSSCLREDEYTLEKNALPRDLDDGWRSEAVERAGFCPQTLELLYEAVFDEKRYPTSRSLLIAKDGFLVSESYMRSESHLDTPSNIQGITKGVTSLLAGIAKEKGVIEDTGRRLYRYIPEYFSGAEEMRDLTVHQVLTMQSGLKWDNEKDTPDLFNPGQFPSTLRVVLQKQPAASPGSLFCYSDGDAQLVSGVISKRADMPLEEFAFEHLFESMKIEDFYWERHPDGLNYGGVGLWMRPRDLLKIGQLILDGGQWSGVQLLPEGWTQKVTGSKVDDSVTGSKPYGYYWWTDPERKGVYVSGRGGQFLYILPSQNLVVVHTAAPYTSPDDSAGFEEFELLLDIITGALE